jgi:hypothetical protein
MDDGRARNHLNVGPGFMQRRRGFERALPRPTMTAIRALELAEVDVLRRLCSESTKPGETTAKG